MSLAAIAKPEAKIVPARPHLVSDRRPTTNDRQAPARNTITRPPFPFVCLQLAFFFRYAQFMRRQCPYMINE